MKRNIVLALLVVVAMAVWRIHVHHTQLARPAVTAEHGPIVIARAPRTESHVASLAGTVRDDAGEPIGGARVCALASSGELPSDVTRDPRCVVTGADGAFTISKLYAADYEVSAMAKQFSFEMYAPDGPDRMPWFPLAANEERRGIHIVLHRGGVEVEGTVSDAGGGVIANAQVRIDASWQRYGVATIVVDTDEHGHYSAWTRAGSFTISANADGYAQAMRSASAPAHLDLTLVPGAALSGSVVDAATGEPMANVMVGANASDGWLSVDTTRTDDQGRFTLTRLAPNRYMAFARTPHGTGLAEGSTFLALGEHADGVVVKLHPAHQIVAHVNADGKPCKRSSLLLTDERQGLQPDVQRDDDGTLHADGVLPGIYIPSPACVDHMSAAHYDPIVVADRDVDVSWTLEAGATLTGRIRTASGTPLANADVSVWSEMTTERVQQAYGTDRTTRDGEYTVHGLPPGRYDLSITRAAGNVLGAPAGPKVVVEVTAKATAHRDVTVPDGDGSIVGRVTTAHGSAGRVMVQAREPDGSSTLVTSDDAGRYEFPTVAAGSYELLVVGGTDHGLFDNLTTGEPTKVSVQAGKPTTANFVVELPTGVIRGRVVDERGAPIGDAFIGLAFEHDEAPALRNARNDSDEALAGADGKFTAEHLSKGPYTVRASRKGGGEAIQAHVAVGSDITLVLKTPGQVSGVAHRSGGAIDDLHVAIYDLDTGDRMRDETFFRTGGKFAVEDLPAGHYVVVVSTGGSQHSTPLNLADGQHAALDVELEGVVTLVGRAVDARTHEPVAGIAMSASMLDTNTSFLLPSDYRNVSDANGRFEVPNTPRAALEIIGRTFDDSVREYDPVTLRRTLTASDPSVVDLGDILVVRMTATTRGDPGLTLDIGGEPRVAKVDGVASGGAAEAAGLVVGDVITAIDGVDVTGDAADEARTLVTGEAGTELRLTLERGATVTVVLAKS